MSLGGAGFGGCGLEKRSNRCASKARRPKRVSLFPGRAQSRAAEQGGGAAAPGPAPSSAATTRALPRPVSVSPIAKCGIKAGFFVSFRRPRGGERREVTGCARYPNFHSSPVPLGRIPELQPRTKISVAAWD